MGGGPFHLRSPWPVSSCLAPLSLLNYHHAPAPKRRSKHALRFALWSPTGLSQSVRWEERVVVSRGGLQRGYHSRAKRFNMSESACTRSVHRFSLRSTLAIISVTGMCPCPQASTPSVAKVLLSQCVNGGGGRGGRGGGARRARNEGVHDVLVAVAAEGLRALCASPLHPRSSPLRKDLSMWKPFLDKPFDSPGCLRLSLRSLRLFPGERFPPVWREPPVAPMGCPRWSLRRAEPRRRWAAALWRPLERGAVMNTVGAMAFWKILLGSNPAPWPEAVINFAAGMSEWRRSPVLALAFESTVLVRRDD